MYSIVLMAALSTGADSIPAPVMAPAPAVGGCCGYSVGCTGYSSGCCGVGYGCGGYSYGCCGYSYGGSYGGSRWHGHKHGCHSYGSCGFDFGPMYGGGGCCGWSYSGAGYGGCYGGAYGGWSYGCGNLPPYGAYNIGGGGGYYGPATVPSPAMAPPVAVPPPAAAPIPPPTKTGAANIRFVLPKEAKLFVDGRETGGVGAERSFYTPELVPGQKFFYDVKAELLVNGETVTEQKRVIVQAGDDLRESFPRLLAAAAPKANTTVATK